MGNAHNCKIMHALWQQMAELPYLPFMQSIVMVGILFIMAMSG